MSFFLGSDEVLSDSEYESARSHLSTPLASPPLDSNGNPDRSTGRVKTKKKHRRGTGLPTSFLRLLRAQVDDDVEKSEDDVNQLHPGEAAAEVEELKRDTHLEPGSALPSTSLSALSSSSQQKCPAAKLKQTPSSSIALAFRPKQEPNKPDQEQQNQNNDLQSLQLSLTQIRTHLSSLEFAISANITSQLVTLTGSPDPVVADAFSLPSFKVEKKQKASVGAILGTVKVVCAIERGLEALIEALEIAGKSEGEGGEKGLMDACLEKPEEVALEMQKAIVGMRRVLKSIPVKS